MAKKPLANIKIFSLITKYSIFGLIFALPLFFLPWTSDVLDFNKQALLLLLVFVALFSWMAQVLVSGKLQVNKNFVNVGVGVFVFLYLLSVIFSIYKSGSFWGWPQIISDSFITVLSLSLLYFVISNTFSKKDIFDSVKILSFSVLAAEIVGLLQLLNLSIIPFDFAKNLAFNTLGSIGTLGLLAAITLPLSIVLLINSKKWIRGVFVLQIVLSAGMLFLINYSVVWWTVAAGSAVIVVFGVLKRNFFDSRWMALPMFFLAVSLFFGILNPQLNLLSQKPNEFTLLQTVNLGIDMKALGESPILGSGPGTFYYNFSKFKDSDFYKTPLWNVTFSRGASKVLDNLSTIGILGVLGLLSVIILPIFYGVKYLFARKEERGLPLNEKEDNRAGAVLTLGILSCFVAGSVAYFLYLSNITLDFIFFLMAGCIVALVYKDRKDFELKSSSLATIIIISIFTLVFIFGFGILYMGGQRYLAEVKYMNGLLQWQAGEAEKGILQMESAASLNPSSDLYFRQLSQAYLWKLQEEIQNTTETPTEEQAKRVQALVANSINASKIATDINPNSVDNWSLRAYVYQNMSGLIDDAEEWAITSYDTALKLSPDNPYLLSQKGTVLVGRALALPDDQKQERSQFLLQAQGELQRAVALVPNYSNALYTLGLTYDFSGQKDKAVEVFKKLQQLNPQDQRIPQILSNLQKGLPALQTPTAPDVNPPANDK